MFTYLLPARDYADRACGGHALLVIYLTLLLATVAGAALLALTP